MKSLPADALAERMLVILNPAAGQDPPVRVRRHIGGALAVRRTPFDLVETEGSGDAERYAQDAVKRGYGVVIAAGGDGTIAEVITGLAGSEVPLGIIPLGTGNQLAANLGIPHDVERAVDVIVHGTRRPIDLGQLGNGRYFALMAGAGWDAEIMGASSRELKERWGFGAYLLQGLRKVGAPPSANFHITADDAILDLRAATVLIVNAGALFSSLFPGEVRLAPDTSLEDGLLDICVFAPRNFPEVATVLWRMARRDYLGDERMIYLRAREVTIEADPPTVAQADGDAVGSTPLTARAVPGGVDVLVPA